MPWFCRRLGSLNFDQLPRRFSTVVGLIVQTWSPVTASLMRYR